MRYGRFGVAAAVGGGLALITALCVVTALVSLFGLQTLQDRFDVISNEKIPALIASSQLMRQSESVVTNAPFLAMASNQFERQAYNDKISDQLDLLDLLEKELARTGVDDRNLDPLRQSKQALVRKLGQIDGLVRLNLSARDRVNLQLDLVRRLRERVQGTGRMPVGRVDPQLLSAWRERMEAVIVPVLISEGVSDSDRLRSIQRNAARALAELSLFFDSLPEAEQEVIAEETDKITRIVKGEGNVFILLSRKLDLRRSIKGELTSASLAASNYSATVSRLHSDIQDDVSATGQAHKGFISDRIDFYIGVSILAVVGAAAVAIYINAGILRRLMWLRESMAAHARGEQADIPRDGNDEIASMADSFSYFVDAINDREKELRESQESLRSILDATPFPIIITRTTDQKVAYINDYAIERFGTRMDEVVEGISPSYYVNPGDRVRLIRLLREEGRVLDYEAPLVQADGKIFWALISAATMNYRGEPSVFFAFLDISERKQMEEDRERSLALTQAALETKTEGVLVVSVEGKVIVWNRRFEEMWRLPADWHSNGDFPDHLLLMSNLVKDKQEFLMRVRTLSTDPDATAMDLVFMRDGRILERYALPYFVGQEIAGRVWAFRDITQRKAMEEDMRRAREVAEEASQAKSAFLATMSHEIRTPMNGVLGMLELLERTPLLDDQLQMVGTIRDSAFALLAIIDDVLDFSKIEAGKLELDAAPASLEEIVDAVAATVAPAARQKNLKLLAFCEPAIPRSLFLDSVRLRQVLLNLVGNAIKFTAQGMVVLYVELEKKTGNEVQLSFHVEDTGMGIPADVRDKLFQPFTQAERSTTRRFGGTGLGLSISRRLVELMGGEIKVDSEPGQGSRFWFTVSFPIGDFAAGTGGDVGDLMDLKILLLSDSKRHAGFLTRYLNHAGASVSNCRDWLEAVQLLENGRASRFDVVVIDDLGIPDQVSSLVSDSHMVLLSSGKDGLEPDYDDDQTILLYRPVGAKQFLRAVAAAGKRMPADLYLGAQAGSGDDGGYPRGLTHEAARYTGAAGPKHTSVPGRIRTPAEDASQASPAGQDQQSAGNSLEDEADREDAPLVMIAEDNKVNLMVLERQLMTLGFRTSAYPDGAAALAGFKESSFDIILTDCDMPKLDGYELTRRIRRWEDEHDMSHIPIVAVTANALKGEDERCRASGMDDYISKPVELARLTEVMQRWLDFPPGGREEHPNRNMSRLSLSGGRGDAVDALSRLQISSAAGPETDAEQDSGTADASMQLPSAAEVERNAVQKAQAGEEQPAATDNQPDNQPVDQASSEGKEAAASDDEPFDRAVLKQVSMDLDPAFLRSMMDHFINVGREVMEAIGTAMSEGQDEENAEKVRRSAHKLKGSAGTLGARTLAALSLDVEQAGREERWSDIETGFAGMKAEFARIEDYIARLPSDRVPDQ